jgi:GT2 family glycosyltransferase
MTTNHERVVAAIPNYNMAVTCGSLVAQLLVQDYNHVYVLDDNSTDESPELAKKYSGEDRFTFVAGAENIGAGGNRNRIIDYEKQGIVHFLDADMELTEPNMTQTLRAAFVRHEDAGIIGFRVRNTDGSQYGYNFGPLAKWPRDMATVLSWKTHKRIPKSAARVLEKVFHKNWQGFWTYMHPEDAEYEHQPETVVECNMAVRLDTFAKVGGFSPEMRFHEIHDLVHKFRNEDKSVWYIPEGEALKHEELDVREHRNRDKGSAFLQLRRKRLTGYYRKKVQ